MNANRGQVYKLEYVGNTVIKKLAGLASLQPAIRDMYALYRKLDGKERHRQGDIASTVLQTTDEGLYIRFRRKGARADEEVFYTAPAILLYDAVRFVYTVADRKGKKVNSAFDPLEKDPALRPPNMYSPLDKKFHFLLPLIHPALFVCVLRRPRGGAKPVTDLHVWRCADHNEALEMMMLLDHVQALFASNESKRAAVFDYNPRRPTAPLTRAQVGGSSNNLSGPASSSVQYVQQNSASTDNLNVVHNRPPNGRPNPYEPSHVRSMVDIRGPGYGVDGRPNPGHHVRSPQPQQRQHQRQDEEVAPWDRPSGSNSGGESYSEMTQWHYQGNNNRHYHHQNQRPQSPAAAAADVPKSRSMANARAGESPKHHQAGHGISGQSADGRGGGGQHPSRLPRTPLSSTEHGHGLPSGNLSRDDSVFIHSRSENDMLRYDAERRRNENHVAVSPPSSRTPAPTRTANNNNAMARQQYNKAPPGGPTILKQSDFLPTSSKPPLDPRSNNNNLNNRESANGAKRTTVTNSNIPTGAIPIAQSKDNNFFFFGMAEPAKKPTTTHANTNNNLNISQYPDGPQTSSGAGFVGGRNGSNSPSTSNYNIENNEDLYRPPHVSSADPVDRASRARQLAAESSFKAQHQSSDDQLGSSSNRVGAYDENGKDLYPLGPALKMLDIGGGGSSGSDRPIARILPHKTYGVQVLPSDVPSGSKSPVPPKLSPISLGLVPGPSSGLRRTETEYYSGSGQKDESVSNNNRRQQLPSINYGHLSAHNSDDEEGSNYVNMQKKTAEIAAILDDIEVDNLRADVVEPIGHVNLEYSLGYFP